MSHIFYLKKLATILSVNITLIKFNINSFEENEEIEKEPDNIEFTEQNNGPEVIKMLLALNTRI